MSSVIPLVDLQAQLRTHKDELEAAIANCLAKASFIGGPEHKAFAEEFGDYCGGHAALCGNGTDALYLAIAECIGFGDGDGEIITVPNTFIATTEAIVRCGYRPVFVDVDPLTHLMDPERLVEAISPRTRGVIPVHLFGQMAPMDTIMDIADAHSLTVIEDAAQAHGAKWLGKGPGQWGHAAAFSFYPGKNLGAFGDAGAVVTRDADTAARITIHANHGRSSKYVHHGYGVNSRMDGLQAAVLRVKLRHLDAWTEARRQAAARYTEGLAHFPGVETPTVHTQGRHVHHLYVVQTEDRDAVLQALRQRGVMAGVHYPVPLHRQPVYESLGYGESDLPVATRLAARILSLPMFPELTKEQTDRVIRALEEIVC